MSVFRNADVRSPGFLILAKLLIYSASLYLIYEVGKGKNWARWSLVVIFVISIPMVVLPFFESMSHNPVNSILGFLQLGLYIAALIFLFHESSSGWFGARKTSKEP